MDNDRRAQPSRLWMKAGIVWLVLSLALGATVAGAYLDIGVWKLPLAMSIAVFKAGLVAAIFMELARAGAGSRLALLACLLWLGLMISLTFADEATRLHLPEGFGTAER